jgi:hypothetical protein
MHPEHTAPWVDSTLNFAWVAGPLILAGWWAPGFGWAVGALTLAVAGMAMAAAFGPLTEMVVVEVLGALGGVGVGALLRRGFGRPADWETIRLSEVHRSASTPGMNMHAEMEIRS